MPEAAGGGKLVERHRIKENHRMNPALTEIVSHPNVKHSELLTVLHSFFKFVTNPLPGRARRFGDQNQGSYLDVHFNNDGTIQTINGKLSDADTKALVVQIRSTLVDNQEEDIGRTICFSLYEAVRGFYRYKDVFQIVPIPKDAPHASMILADHPFVLESKYVSCPDQMIDTNRHIEAAAQLARILNTFCNTAVSARSVYVRYFWGIFDDKELSSRWTQEGYVYGGFPPGHREGFSSTEGIPPIRLFPAAEYYDELFFPRDHSLALPDEIDRYLDKVFSLTGSDANAFEIASIWFAQVKELWPRASSSALVAVVSGIEALLEKNSEICRECGQLKFGINKKFKDFLKTYVPGVVEQFPEAFKAIYETRSQLAHGKLALMADRRRWNYLGDPLQQWEGRFQRNVYRITATALRNWVLSR